MRRFYTKKSKNMLINLTPNWKEIERRRDIAKKHNFESS